MILRVFVGAVCCLLVAATACAAPAAPSAIEQLARVRAELTKSRASNDWQSNLASALEQKALLNASPRSLLEVARAELHLGHEAGALAELRQFARMGQVIDMTDFAALGDADPVRQIRSAMAANQSPVALGTTAVVLRDAHLLAEDLEYEGSSGGFLITSVREKKIVALAPDGASRDIALEPDGWPMVALKVDGARQLLWATAVAMRDLNFAPQAQWGRSALLCYGLRSGKLLRRIEGPNPSALGDLVLTRQGDVIVSDGEGGGVYRLPAGGDELERIDGGDFISPQTAALHPEDRYLFVPDYLRGIGVLDLSTRQVRWLAMEGRFALAGIDGLYFDHGRLIAVQNGTSPERVVAFNLDASLGKITSETVIERATQTLGDPTHGVVVGGRFYYIANSGWDAIDEHGELKRGVQPSAPRIMRVELAGLR